MFTNMTAYAILIAYTITYSSGKAWEKLIEKMAPQAVNNKKLGEHKW